jgi:hypothetical protein
MTFYERKRLLLKFALVSFLWLACGTRIVVAGELLNAVDGIAMDGFDVVAYFQEGKPVKGRSLHSVKYKEQTWVFDTAANAEAFGKNPEAYEPRFNGWCAYAVSEGYGAEVDFIDGWAILDGKLYLNWNKKVRDDFVASQSELKPRAHNNWPDVLAGIVDDSIEIERHRRIFGIGIRHPQQLEE